MVRALKRWNSYFLPIPPSKNNNLVLSFQCLKEHHLENMHEQQWKSVKEQVDLFKFSMVSPNDFKGSPPNLPQSQPSVMPCPSLNIWKVKKRGSVMVLKIWIHGGNYITSSKFTFLQQVLVQCWLPIVFCLQAHHMFLSSLTNSSCCFLYARN